jgi:hypothetical protein
MCALVFRKGTTSLAFVMTNNVVFGNRYPVANKTYLSSSGVLISLPQAATPADLSPESIVKLEKTCKDYVPISLHGYLDAIGAVIIVAYLLNTQYSPFAQKYQDRVDAHIIS